MDELDPRDLVLHRVECINSLNIDLKIFMNQYRDVIDEAKKESQLNNLLATLLPDRVMNQIDIYSIKQKKYKTGKFNGLFFLPSDLEPNILPLNFSQLICRFTRYLEKYEHYVRQRLLAHHHAQFEHLYFGFGFAHYREMIQRIYIRALLHIENE